MSRNNLRVGGLTPLTTIDYPDHLSCVIYCQGCSWQCRYCHNPELISCNQTTQTAYLWPSIIDFLSKRQGLLEAVVFSGGEPLMQTSIFDAIEQVKALGFKIGLHTGGSSPKMFQKILPLVDWVGFDVKGLPEQADAIIQVKGAAQKNWQSLDMLVSSETNFSCRTTVHWQLFEEQQLLDLTQILSNKGVLDYSIQFSRTKKMLDPTLSFSLIEPTRLEKLKTKLQTIMPTIKFIAA